MKKPLCILITFALANAALTQAVSSTATTIGSSAFPASTPYIVVSNDANSAVWQCETFTSGPNGTIVTNIHSYVELATGLNYTDPVSGKLLPSKEEIDAYPGGANARYGQHKVIFANNLNTPGAIDLQTPDGKELRSDILGLSYYDSTSGKSVLIAEVQDSQGELVSSNEVLYPNAFQGIKASALYHYTRAGLEQDVILLEQPPSPEAFGLSSTSCVLQVLTEFIAAPAPVIQASPSLTNNVLSDERLDFGAMKMVQGRAFLLGTNAPAATIVQHWLTVSNRTVFVESMPWPALTNSLSQLPAFAGTNLKSAVGSAQYIVSSQRLLPPLPTAPTTRTEMKLALSDAPTRGFDLDLIFVNSSSNSYIFRSDVTYAVTGPVNFGSHVTFEGGSVIKYWANASLNIYDPGQIISEGTAYRPTIFTACADNSVGLVMGSGNPNGYYANPAISFNGSIQGASSLTLHDFRISYACGAIHASGICVNVVIEDGQIVNCWEGYYSPGQSGATFANVLFANVSYPFDLGIASVQVYNSTFCMPSSDQWPLAIGQAGVEGSAFLMLENCILANIYTYSINMPHLVTGDHNGFYNSGVGSWGQYGDPTFLGYPTFGSSPIGANGPPFQNAGGGNYYLAGGCGFQAVGTLNVGPSVLEDIQTKTTQPPDATSYVNQSITQDTYLYPRGLANTSTPDLGYHYPVVDYMVGNDSLSASLYLENGVTIGLEGSQALTPQNGGQVFSAGYVSTGNAYLINHIVSAQNVQEAAPMGGNIFILLNSGTDATRQFQFQFTDFSVGEACNGNIIAGGSVLAPFQSISFQDCSLSGVQLGADFNASGAETISLDNNLCQRMQIVFNNNYGNVPPTVNCYNNLLRGCYMIVNTVGANWTIKDNLFDGNGLAIFYGNGSSANTGFNGYTAGTMDPFNRAGDITGLVADYQNGPLGGFYYPGPNSGDLGQLIDAGSRTAATAGLGTFTTRLSQSTDSDTVDIGYHYPVISAPVAQDDSYEQPSPNNPYTIDLYSYAQDPSGLPLTYIIVAGPAHGTLTQGSSMGQFIYTPNDCFEGQDTFTYEVTDGYVSSATATVTLNITVPGPELTAQCRLDQIVLNWSLDSAVQEMMQLDGLTIYDYQVYRSTSLGGPYSLIGTANSGASTYVDMNATSGVTYHYVVTFRYQVSNCQTLYESPYSVEASVKPCSLPPPIRPGFNQQILAANDDNTTGDGDTRGVRIPNQAAIGFPINFFGTTYSALFVNNNGNVTFYPPANNYLDWYTPTPLSEVGKDIIAPFWADVDTRGPGSGLVTYGQGTVDGHAAFAINWVNVGFFQMKYDKLNSFQLVLIDRSDLASGDFDVEFNYERVQWETGQADRGIDGLCGNPAYPPRAGYATANGTTFELNGSGVPGAFLDSNPTTGLIYNHLNTDFPGRYLFSFRDGTSGILPAVVFNPAGSDTLPVTVTLSVPGHPTASIYYTSDGTTPTTTSTLYSGSINVTADETLNAIAVETGWGNSEVSSTSFGFSAPVIITQPSDQTTIVEGTATFTVVANGVNPLSYEWYHSDNGRLVGTEATLTLQNVQQGDAGTYNVIVRDPSYNSVQSSDAILTVTSPSPSSPGITITSPGNGDNVGGSITVQAIGQGNDPAVRASLWVDGNIVANQWFAPPYNFTFDTTTLPNGIHQLIAKTYDLYNDQGISTAVNVNVNNLIFNNKLSANYFIPNGDDVSARTVTLSANFTVAANWTLTIKSSAGNAIATFSGAGNQMSQVWDGTGATGPDQYTLTLTATPSSQGSEQNNVNSSQTVIDPVGTIYPAPDWNNVASIKYHAYGGDLKALAWWAIAFDVAETYVGLSPACMLLPGDVYTYENRTWETLFGYDGDEIVNFNKSDLLSRVKSDNVCYIIAHGFGTATASTTIVDSHGGWIQGGTIYGANLGNQRGYMFVQINACSSGTWQDSVGNNDLAIGFGIANTPMTHRRAFLGWRARFGGDWPWYDYPMRWYDGNVINSPAGLYSFDQLLWQDLYNGMTVQDAVGDAYSSAPQPTAVPIIYGDPSLILPQLY